MPEIIAPMEAPSMDMFTSELEDIQEPIIASETLPLPEGGFQWAGLWSSGSITVTNTCNNKTL